ncbi:hypothetical protein DMUE_4038 [Dictyocoela muelleri]|nr:hypothetical protein DMUE_4038 [Dictyocoela muelleri]
MLLSGLTYKHLGLWQSLSKATISSVKHKVLEGAFRNMNDRPILLGGLDVIVEADETAICRRGIIRNPSNTADEVADTVWILGVIDNTPLRNFYLQRVDDRRSNTITQVLLGKIYVASVLHTDGYPSYPEVARNLGVRHKVVNHTLGIVNAEGIHTNNIRGFWSDLKSTMRKENGVLRENIDHWLAYYCFKEDIFPTQL